jgi:hypothetical protein
VVAGAASLARFWQEYPERTVHVVVVDPGVGGPRAALVVSAGGRFGVGPDNGVLTPMLVSPQFEGVREIGNADLFRHPVSATFHGRDVFAPVAAELAAGRTQPASLGTVASDWAPAWLDEPEVTADRIAGVVVAIDTFGNLISNIDGMLLGGRDAPVIHVAGRNIPLVPTYGRARPGDYLALVNSFGVLEVARAEGDAATGLGVERGAPVTVSWP